MPGLESWWFARAKGGGGVDLGVLPAAVRTKPKMVVRGVGVLVTVCFYGIAGAHR